MSVLTDSFTWVNNKTDEWGLDPKEKIILFGQEIDAEAVAEIDPKSEEGVALQEALNTIALIEAKLASVFGRENAGYFAKWLRTSIEPLGNKSPLKFLEDGETKEALLLTMDGP